MDSNHDYAKSFERVRARRDSRKEREIPADAGELLQAILRRVSMDLRNPAFNDLFSEIERLSKAAPEARVVIDRAAAIVIRDFLVAGTAAVDAFDRGMNSYEHAVSKKLSKTDRIRAFARELGIDDADHFDPMERNRVARERLYLYAEHLYSQADSPESPTRKEMDNAVEHVVRCLLEIPTIRERKKKRPTPESVASELRAVRRNDWVKAHWPKDFPRIERIRLPPGR